MSLEEIQRLLPHRHPMLLVDEIVWRNESSIVCRKQFDGSEFFFQGHYPDNPIVPGVILVESGVQAGAILVAAEAAGAKGIPVLARLNDVRFRQIVRPGDAIEIHAEIQQRVSKVYYLRVRMRRGDRVAGSFTCAVTITEPLAATEP